MDEILKPIQAIDLKVGDRVKFMCNLCRIETIQKLDAAHSVLRIEGEYDPNYIWDTYRVSETLVEVEVQYRFFVCQGCGAACLQELTGANGDEEWMMAEFFPERLLAQYSTGQWVEITPTTATPKRYNNLPEGIWEAYWEIIRSCNENLRLSCAFLMRALIEGICVNQGITDKDAWGLEGKLKLLEDKKILAGNIVDGLLVFKFMGDDAAHRLDVADKQELRIAIDVMEDVLNALYEMNYRLTLNARKLANTRTTQIAEHKQRTNPKK